MVIIIIKKETQLYSTVLNECFYLNSLSTVNTISVGSAVFNLLNGNRKGNFETYGNDRFIFRLFCGLIFPKISVAYRLEENIAFSFVFRLISK